MGALRVSVARIRQRRFRKRVVTHTYGGHPLRVEIRSPYGEMYDKDWPVLGEIAFLERHGSLRPGARVFNLGANHGVIAMMLAAWVGPEGEVIALEADPWLAAGAERNARLNELGQLVAVHAAVGREDGEIRFGAYGDVDDGSGRFGRVRVPALSIDSLAARHGSPDLVFMDVEGYELEALRGAERTLAERPDWFVEVHGADLPRYGGSVEEVIGTLRGRGYDCYGAWDDLGTLPDGEFVSLTQFRPLEEMEDELEGRRFFLVALGGSAAVES
jgi:FkbM family methyltransferase